MKKVKRLAWILLIGCFFVACTDSPVVDPDPDKPPTPRSEVKDIKLKIHIPLRNPTTFASEDAYNMENTIDTIYIDLYETCPSRTKLGSYKFEVTPLILQDSTITVGFEADNIACTTTPLEVEVFANKRSSGTISAEPYPTFSNRNTYFFMSGKGKLTLNSTSTAYEGTAHVIRNVAKLRVNIAKNSITYPNDLEIDYANVKIQVLHATDSTKLFDLSDDPVYYNAPNLRHLDYSARTGLTPGPNSLRPHTLSTMFNTTNGGQIDSLYLFENLRNDWTSPGIGLTEATKIRITIPTTSATEGNKTEYYDYPLYTVLNSNKYDVQRNYIYILDIKVRAQGGEPLIQLDIRQWNDVPVDGDVKGTYLNLEKSEIVFNSSGEATINFCTDAQAVYFDFSEFNLANPTVQIGTDFKAIGIDTSRVNFPLAPAGYQDGQILLDRQTCSSFGFKLAPNFPTNTQFSGKICLIAGNIVKCLTFPANNLFDAHFIVGEPILGGELFTYADVVDAASKPWLQISTFRAYNGSATQSFTGAPTALYLHLDENLTNADRTGTITLTNASGYQKRLDIKQLRAIPVGRFGHHDKSLEASDSWSYTSGLYTEQRYEAIGLNGLQYQKNPLPPLANPSYNWLNHSLYSTADNFNWSVYSNSHLNSPTQSYTDALYSAMNYCAHKNRITSNSTPPTLLNELKWYLPSQAQLMGMWITYESYKNASSSNFPVDWDQAYNFWSASGNVDYPQESQYVNFYYGNVGHLNKTRQLWVRCVRNMDGAATQPMVVEGNPYPLINFTVGLPNSAWTTDHKTPLSSHHERNALNDKVYYRLRVALSDLGGNVDWTFDLTRCNSYSESGAAAGTWRLPTQRELMAIWILQHEILQPTYYTFDLLSNNYYWSGTDASTTGGSNAWTIYGGTTYHGVPTTVGGAGNAPHWLKSYSHRIRCVHED